MIVIGSDHRGYKMKEIIKTFLKKRGCDVIDVGTYEREATDYPIYAEKVAENIISNAAESGMSAPKGILVCGTGFGMCIAANKFKGIRAVTVRTVLEAELSVRHNNANVICLGIDITGPTVAKKIVKTYFETKFEGGRHQRRLNLIRRFNK